MTASYYNTKDAAEALGCHQSTITRLVERGELVPTMKGPGATGAYFFLPADVERLAAKRARVAS